MEKYAYGSGNSAGAPVKLGKFFNLVHEKHIDAYGENGADNIVENIIESKLLDGALQTLPLEEELNNLNAIMFFLLARFSLVKLLTLNCLQH